MTLHLIWNSDKSTRSTYPYAAFREGMCVQGAAVPLSTDQTADREDERQRIVQAGGHVSHVLGNWRIGQAGIQVSRSGFGLCLEPVYIQNAMPPQLL